MRFPLWVGKSWTIFPELEWQGRVYPALTAAIIGTEESTLPLKRLPTFKIAYDRGGELSSEGWWSPNFLNWAKQSWEGGSEELWDFWWLSPEEALDRTYQALAEAIKLFPEQAMHLLALLIQYELDPARTWAILEGSR